MQSFSTGGTGGWWWTLAADVFPFSSSVRTSTVETAGFLQTTRLETLTTPAFSLQTLQTMTLTATPLTTTGSQTLRILPQADPVPVFLWHAAQALDRLPSVAGSFLLADPSRLLGWTGRALSEFGFEGGKALGFYGALLEPSTTKMIGSVSVGTFGATIGRSFGGVFGGIIGGIGGGTIGGWIGSWFDPPNFGIFE